MKCKKCKYEIISDKYDGYCYQCYKDLSPINNQLKLIKEIKQLKDKIANLPSESEIAETIMNKTNLSYPVDDVDIIAKAIARRLGE